jgi:predicted MPP superfamily phosphohydrolase
VEPFKKSIRFFIGITTLLILLAFFGLYIWPFNPRGMSRFDFHFIFNVVLSIDFAVKTPLAISFIAGLFFAPRSKHVIYIMGIILSISILITMFYGSIFGSKELNVNEIEIQIKDLPRSFDGYRIAQISDIHLGSFISSKSVMKSAVNKIANANVNLILFTGDLVNNFANETAHWEAIFQSITKPIISYSILGNHDYGNYSVWDNEHSKSDNFQKIIDAHQQFGFHLLNNQNSKIVFGNDSIYIAGVENWGHPPFPQYANLDQALKGIPSNSFIILLSHDPAHWDEVIKTRNDIRLTLSGHTHGLQWGISRAGFRFSLSYLARRNWGGLYKFEDNYLYVNAGLGMVAIPWRINMPAEITIITLKRIEVD